MEVTRIFHPVGQGGFYTESFDNKRMVVYDCGGSDNVKESIDSLFDRESSPQIEAVFISHLHDDHINGLQYLLHKTSAKRLFMPCFSQEIVFETLFYNSLQNPNRSSINSFVVSLIESARSGQSFMGDTRITTISDESSEREFPSYALNENIPPAIPSGTHLTEDKFWVYIPYNPKSQKIKFSKVDIKYRSTIEQIYNETSAEKQAKSLAEFVKNHSVKTCKEIYKALFGGIHNSQSMPVFSGILPLNNMQLGHPLTPFCHFDIDIDCHHHDFLGHCFIDWHHYTPHAYFSSEKIICNFLYTGDYNAQKEENTKAIIKFYKEHQAWDTICGIQIPHHGSKHNYHPALYEGRCYAVASAGVRNKYRHPHVETLNKIYQQKCFPFVVTEDSPIRFEQYIHYYQSKKFQL